MGEGQSASVWKTPRCLGALEEGSRGSRRLGCSSTAGVGGGAAGLGCGLGSA